jgi:hypothetical protein
MRIIGISCVRDEDDIIESFVRHNLAYLDKLYVIDNLSKDKTVAILASLANEGLAVEVWESTSCSNQQDRAITVAVKKMAELEPAADFAVLLDADEFLAAPDRQSFIGDLEKIEPDGYGVMPWKTYIPVEDDLENLNPSVSVTSRMTHRRSVEGYQMYKSVIPKALFKKVRVRPGSHVVERLDGGACERTVLASPLAHFPIRSANQLIAKIILFNHSRMLKKDSRPKESFHWAELAASIRARNFRITRDEIREYALSYSVRSTDEKPTEFVYDPLPAHDSLTVKYFDAEIESLIHRFDRYIIRLQENNHIVPKEDTEFEKKDFHPIGAVRESLKQGRRWIKRRLGLSRKA